MGIVIGKIQPPHRFMGCRDSEENVIKGVLLTEEERQRLHDDMASKRIMVSFKLEGNIETIIGGGGFGGDIYRLFVMKDPSKYECLMDYYWSTFQIPVKDNLGGWERFVNLGDSNKQIKMALYAALSSGNDYQDAYLKANKDCSYMSRGINLFKEETANFYLEFVNPRVKTYPVEVKRKGLLKRLFSGDILIEKAFDNVLDRDLVNAISEELLLRKEARENKFTDYDEIKNFIRENGINFLSKLTKRYYSTILSNLNPNSHEIDSPKRTESAPVGRRAGSTVSSRRSQWPANRVWTEGESNIPYTVVERSADFPEYR